MVEEERAAHRRDFKSADDNVRLVAGRWHDREHAQSGRWPAGTVALQGRLALKRAAIIGIPAMRTGQEGVYGISANGSIF